MRKRAAKYPVCVCLLILCILLGFEMLHVRRAWAAESLDWNMVVDSTGRLLHSVEDLRDETQEPVKPMETWVSDWQEMASVNTRNLHSESPMLSPDGLTFYYAKEDASHHRKEIWEMTRSTQLQAFGTPAESVCNISDMNNMQPTVWLSSEGEKRVIFVAAKEDVWEQTDLYEWNGTDAPTAIASVNTGYAEAYPCVRPDGQILFFSSTRPGSRSSDIYYCSRTSTNVPFEGCTKIQGDSSFNSSDFEMAFHIWFKDGVTSIHGKTCYWARRSPTSSNSDIYYGTISVSSSEPYVSVAVAGKFSQTVSPYFESGSTRDSTGDFYFASDIGTDRKNHLYRISSIPEAETWLVGMGSGAGWNTFENPRFLADVNGDGKDDIVGCAKGVVCLALSEGSKFATPVEAIDSSVFCKDSGWKTDRHPRFVADVSGDGKADFVGFGDGGIWVAVSNGTGFNSATQWTKGFGYNAFWRCEHHPRFLGDVNGDGKMDAVGFGDHGVTISTADSSGTGFDDPERWTFGFGREAFWDVAKHPRILGDVNGDGMDDVAGFGDRFVTVALSTGKNFEAAVGWYEGFGRNAGWDASLHPRYFRDMNGDGCLDVIGFKGDGVYVALSTGSAFALAGRWIAKFGSAPDFGGWNDAVWDRFVRDVDDDGKADLLCIDSGGVSVSLSTGIGLLDPIEWIGEFGSGWVKSMHPRLTGHVDGDKFLDIVGFHTNGVVVY